MPEASTWKYLENQFDARTRDNRLLMDKLVQDHGVKLAAAAALPGADARLVTLAAGFIPIKNAWNKEYLEWKNAGPNYGGSTVSLETLLANLSSKPGPEQASKIEEWDSRIRAQVPKGSATYVTLLPQGRAPFSGGSRESIINAVSGLGERLAAQTGNAELVALGLEVTDYHNDLKTARNAQQAMEGQAGTESADVDPARTAAAQALYGNLGMLMHIYQDNPMMIAGFFDLEMLRQAGKTTVVPPPGP